MFSCNCLWVVWGAFASDNAGPPASLQIPQLVLVDAGMVAQLDREEQENFIGLFQSFGAGDGEKVAALILTHLHT
jgi:predicted unusual protein kinase regulating ubiquinone biosynthesis (AarF/ABC1/UbiB family)